MPLTRDMSKDAVIHDIVHSKNSRFKGDSKKQRVRRALAIWRRLQSENLDEVDERRYHPHSSFNKKIRRQKKIRHTRALPKSGVHSNALGKAKDWVHEAIVRHIKKNIKQQRSIPGSGLHQPAMPALGSTKMYDEVSPHTGKLIDERRLNVVMQHQRNVIGGGRDPIVFADGAKALVHPLRSQLAIQRYEGLRTGHEKNQYAKMLDASFTSFKQATEQGAS